MAFGKRAPGAWGRTPSRSRLPSRLRLVSRRAVFGLALGMIGLGATTSLVRASERSILTEMFDALFGAPKTPTPVAAAPVAIPPKAQRRYASLPDAWTLRTGPSLAQRTQRVRARTPRPVLTAATHGFGPPALKGTQTVCVRLCDGLPFPVGRLRDAADLPIHQAACAAACPGARTELFTLASGRADYEQAVSLTGQSYRLAAYAGLYRRTRVAECACRPAAASGSQLSPGDDRTVREGDVFATEDSADVVTALTPNGPVLTDYREAEIAEKRRRSIEGRVGAIRRDAEAAAFRQVLRLADHRARRIQIAEVRIDRSGADESVTGFSELPGAGTGFTSVRVVAPSPYGQ